MLRVAILDHDAAARTAMKHLLARQADLELVAECADGDGAISAIRSLTPHIVFLDVNIPGPNGFEVLDAVHSYCTPAVIFVTENDQHAIKAFEAGALDYIIKPVTEGRLGSALDRARKRALAEPATLVQQIKELVNGNGHRKPSVQRMPLKSGGRIVLVDVNQIRWIESAGNYLRFNLQGESHMVRDTLTSLEASLDPDQFVRIHRSTIVNRHYIKELIPSDSGEYTVITDNGKKLTLSRSYRDRFERLTAHSNGH
ncbi:MAG TPA: LytTR family DNA-binding domain-containing protein [Candidatus Angelobacter sp.]